MELPAGHDLSGGRRRVLFGIYAGGTGGAAVPAQPQRVAVVWGVGVFVSHGGNRVLDLPAAGIERGADGHARRGASAFADFSEINKVDDRDNQCLCQDTPKCHDISLSLGAVIDCSFACSRSLE